MMKRISYIMSLAAVMLLTSCSSMMNNNMDTAKSNPGMQCSCCKKHDAMSKSCPIDMKKDGKKGCCKSKCSCCG